MGNIAEYASALQTKFPFGFADALSSGVVNVSTIPQRSPFRYPGGKTWLIPVIRKWLARKGPVARLVEPFAGGGIVSLTAVFENLADRALMVERDPNVAAVWQAVLSGGAPNLPIASSTSMFVFPMFERS